MDDIILETYFWHFLSAICPSGENGREMGDYNRQVLGAHEFGTGGTDYVFHEAKKVRLLPHVAQMEWVLGRGGPEKYKDPRYPFLIVPSRFDEIEREHCKIFFKKDESWWIAPLNNARLQISRNGQERRMIQNEEELITGDRIILKAPRGDIGQLEFVVVLY